MADVTRILQAIDQGDAHAAGFRKALGFMLIRSHILIPFQGRPGLIRTSTIVMLADIAVCAQPYR